MKQIISKTGIAGCMSVLAAAIAAVLSLTVLGCDNGTSATKLNECAITAFVLPDILGDIAGDIDQAKRDIILVAPGEHYRSKTNNHSLVQSKR
ncbi:hypothetical protein FACS1894190_17760 [Spirochaetia bacterium]|nr:hypothetical protein FACS1894190_17760 [Spirochaetia bacterium]